MDFEQVSRQLMKLKLRKRDLVGLFQEIVTQNEFRSHPLGFFRLKLSSTSVGPVYLHYWPDTQKYIEHNELRVHRHSVDVFSLVLMGEVEDEQYSWLDDCRGPLHLLKQDLSGKKQGLEKTGIRGMLQQETRRLFRAGDCYTVSKACFHRSTWTRGRVAATLCVFAGESLQAPMVVEPFDRNILEGCYRPTLLSRTATKDILAQILHAISS